MRLQVVPASARRTRSAPRDPEDALVAVYLFPNDAAPKGRLLDRLASAFETCAPIEHPNVLRVIDYGPEGSSGFLVTEWVECTTLARLIEVHGRLPEANVIRFAAQLGQALDHTRTGDEALCRPKPTSVLVRTDGLAKLIPFGLSDENSNSVSRASSLLKPEFAASLAADSVGVKRVLFAEAIFSLGTLIYEAAHGVGVDPATGADRPPVAARRRNRSG